MAGEVFTILDEAAAIPLCRFDNDYNRRYASPPRRSLSIMYFRPLAAAAQTRLKHTLSQHEDDAEFDPVEMGLSSVRILTAMVDHAAQDDSLEVSPESVQIARQLVADLDPATRSRLACADDEELGSILARFDEADPFGFRRHLRGERERLRRWRELTRMTEPSPHSINDPDYRIRSIRWSSLVNESDAEAMREEVAALPIVRLRDQMVALADTLRSRVMTLLSAASTEDLDAIEAELQAYFASDPPPDLRQWHDVYMRHYLRAARESFESLDTWKNLIAPAGVAPEVD